MDQEVRQEVSDSELFESLTEQETATIEAYRSGRDPETNSANVEPNSVTAEGEPPPDGEDYEGDELVTVGPDGKPRDEKGRYVPHAALHKERERRKATESELQAYRERMARAEERMNVLNDVLRLSEQPQQPQKAEPEDPRPDPQEDIFAYVQWQERQIQRQQDRYNELMQQQQQFMQRTQQTQQLAAVQERYKAEALEFANKTPDFRDAYQHLRQSYVNELAARGMDEATINRVLLQEEFEVAQQSIAVGRNPGQVLYEMAKARGYAPKAAPTPQNTPQTAEAQRLGTIAEAQQRAVTLNGTGGTGGTGLTLQALADMSEEQFEATVQKVGKQKIAELLGG